MYAALQYAASFHCSVEEWKDCEELKPKPKEKLTFVDQKEVTIHRTEWCAEANKYRCMRCGRGSKYMKMPGKCAGPKYLSTNLGKWCKQHTDYARQRMGPKLMPCCKPEQVGTKEHDKMKKRIQVLEDGRVPAKKARDCKIEGQNRRVTRKEYQRLLNKFEMEGFMTKNEYGISLEKRCCRIVKIYPRKRVTSLENASLCMKKLS